MSECRKQHSRRDQFCDERCVGRGATSMVELASKSSVLGICKQRSPKRILCSNAGAKRKTRSSVQSHTLDMKVDALRKLSEVDPKTLSAILNSIRNPGSRTHRSGIACLDGQKSTTNTDSDTDWSSDTEDESTEVSQVMPAADLLPLSRMNAVPPDLLECQKLQMAVLRDILATQKRLMDSVTQATEATEKHIHLLSGNNQ